MAMRNTCLGAASVKNRILVVVEDTGPGIRNKAALSSIFKRFYSRSEEHFGNKLWPRARDSKQS